MTLNLDPDAAAAAVGERTKGILPVHIFGYPAAMPELEELAAQPRPRHPRGRLRGARRRRLRGPRGRRPRQPRHLRLLRQQADDHRGGRDDRPLRPGVAARLRSERNQGRAADMGWLDHERPRLQLPALRPRRRARRRPGREARRAAGAAGRGRGAVRAARWRGLEGVEVPIAGRAARSGAAGSSTSSASPTRSTATRRSPAWPSAASPAKAYLPCIHLFPHLRELGYREGQFPVAEAAAARSLALPFFPAMSEARSSASVRSSPRLRSGR